MNKFETVKKKKRLLITVFAVSFFASIQMSFASSVLDEIFDSIGDLINLMLGGILYYIASSLYELMDAEHLTLDYLFKSDETTNLVFSLNKGNLYGTVAATINVYLRVTVLSFAIISFLLILFRALLKSREALLATIKTELGNYIVAMSSMVFTPYVVYAVIFIRTVLFDYISNATSYMVGGTSIYSSFLGDTDSNICRVGSGYNIGYCMVFLGLVCVTIFYALVYLSIAVNMFALVAFYPFFALKGARDESMINEWFSRMFGYALVPTIDFVIFSLVIVAMRLRSGMMLVFFLACLVISQRMKVARWLKLDVGDSSFGIGGAALVVGAAKTAFSGVKNLASGTINKGKKSAEDWDKGKRESEADREGLRTEEERTMEEGLEGGAVSTSSETGSTTANDEVPVNTTSASSSEDAPTSGRLESTSNSDTTAESETSETSENKGADSGTETMGETSASRSIDANAQTGAVRGSTIDAATANYRRRRKVADVAKAREIARKRINGSNFDRDGNLEHLTHAERAKAYKRRAVLGAVGGTLSTAGKVAGGVTGGLVGFGAGAFLPAGTQAATAFAGASLGSGAVTLGGKAVSFGASAAYNRFNRNRYIASDAGQLNQIFSEPGSLPTEALGDGSVADYMKSSDESGDMVMKRMITDLAPGSVDDYFDSNGMAYFSEDDITNIEIASLTDAGRGFINRYNYIRPAITSEVSNEMMTLDSAGGREMTVFFSALQEKAAENRKNNPTITYDWGDSPTARRSNILDIQTPTFQRAPKPSSIMPTAQSTGGVRRTEVSSEDVLGGNAGLPQTRDVRSPRGRRKPLETAGRMKPDRSRTSNVYRHNDAELNARIKEFLDDD